MFVAALTIFAVGKASADWSWSGTDPTSGSGIDYDQIGIFWGFGDKFKTPAFTGLSESWQNFDSVNTSTAAYAFGPSTSDGLSYTLNFTGSNNFSSLLYQVSLNSVVVGRSVGTFWNGGAPVGGDYTGTDAAWHASGGGDPVAVPEPVSTALFILGGATLAMRRLRRK